jgi:hypothetical protein
MKECECTIGTICARQQAGARDEKEVTTPHDIASLARPIRVAGP